MNDFEQFLKRRRVPTVPAQWRGEILAAARAQMVDSQQEDRTREKPWWIGWLWPSPVAWAGLACAWGLALGMNAASDFPVKRNPAQVSVPQSEAIILVIMQERQLVRESFQIQEEPPEPPRRRDRRDPSGACNGRRGQRIVAMA